MLIELPLFGALAPSFLLYFLSSIVLFVIADRLVITPLGVYRLVWHPPLVRLALFLCVFSALVFATRS